jgi:nucleoside 2-deoxyribosyltransferase
VKVYVAGRTSMVKEVRVIQGIVISESDEISYDWTVNVEEVGGAASDINTTPEQRRAFAEADKKGVKDAHVVVALMGPQVTGTLIEIGMCLGDEKPLIIIGNPPRESVFFDLPSVIRISDNSQLREALAHVNLYYSLKGLNHDRVLRG